MNLLDKYFEKGIGLWGVMPKEKVSTVRPLSTGDTLSVKDIQYAVGEMKKVSFPIEDTSPMMELYKAGMKSTKEYNKKWKELYEPKSITMSKGELFWYRVCVGLGIVCIISCIWAVIQWRG